jgi:hypothetical protein
MARKAVSEGTRRTQASLSRMPAQFIPPPPKTTRSWRFA